MYVNPLSPGVHEKMPRKAILSFYPIIFPLFSFNLTLTKGKSRWAKNVKCANMKKEEQKN